MAQRVDISKYLPGWTEDAEPAAVAPRVDIGKYIPGWTGDAPAASVPDPVNVIRPEWRNVPISETGVTAPPPSPVAPIAPRPGRPLLGRTLPGDERLATLEEFRDEAGKRTQTIGAAPAKGVIGNLASKTTRDVLDLIPVARGFVNAAELKQLRKDYELVSAADRNPDMTDAEVTALAKSKGYIEGWGWDALSKAQTRINDYEDRERRKSTSNRTLLGDISEGLVQMAPYMAEMSAVPGAGVGGNLLQRGVGLVARSAVGAATAGSGQIAAGYQSRRLGQVRWTPEGEAVIANSKGPAEAFFKAAGETLISTLSEQTGEAIAGGLGKIAAHTPGVKTVAAKLAAALDGAAIRAGKAGGLFGNLYRTTGAALKRAKYNGLIGELGEERLEGVLQSVFGTQDFGLEGDKNTVLNRLIESIPSGREMLVEAGVLAVPGATTSAFGLAADTLTSRSQAPKVAMPSPGSGKSIDLRTGIGLGVPSREAADPVVQPRGVDVAAPPSTGIYPTVAESEAVQGAIRQPVPSEQRIPSRSVQLGLPQEGSNAVQEPEAAQVDVREQAGNGGAVGEGNAEGQAVAEASQAQEVAKEPWQMTRDDVVWGIGYAAEGANTDRALKGRLSRWKKIQQAAAAEGESIPSVDEAIAKEKARIARADAHRAAVEAAAKQGKIGEGIKDYPDLVAKYAKPAQPEAPKPTLLERKRESRKLRSPADQELVSDLTSSPIYINPASKEAAWVREHLVGAPPILRRWVSLSRGVPWDSRMTELVGAKHIAEGTSLEDLVLRLKALAREKKSTPKEWEAEQDAQLDAAREEWLAREYNRTMDDGIGELVNMDSESDKAVFKAAGLSEGEIYAIAESNPDLTWADAEELLRSQLAEEPAWTDLQAGTVPEGAVVTRPEKAEIAPEPASEPAPSTKAPEAEPESLPASATADFSAIPAKGIEGAGATVGPVGQSTMFGVRERPTVPNVKMNSAAAQAEFERLQAVAKNPKTPDAEYVSAIAKLSAMSKTGELPGQGALIEQGPTKLNKAERPAKRKRAPEPAQPGQAEIFPEKKLFGEPEAKPATSFGSLLVSTRKIVVPKREHGTAGGRIRYSRRSMDSALVAAARSATPESPSYVVGTHGGFSVRREPPFSVQPYAKVDSNGVAEFYEPDIPASTSAEPSEAKPAPTVRESRSVGQEQDPAKYHGKQYRPADTVKEAERLGYEASTNGFVPKRERGAILSALQIPPGRMAAAVDAFRRGAARKQEEHDAKASIREAERIAPYLDEARMLVDDSEEMSAVARDKAIVRRATELANEAEFLAEADVKREEADAEADAEASEKMDAEQSAVAEATRRIKKHGWRIASRHDAETGSVYLNIERDFTDSDGYEDTEYKTVRISDHNQPAGGGYVRVDSTETRPGWEGPAGDADVDIVYTGNLQAGLISLDKVLRPADQTQTPEFKRWFGNSKVVDENGKPIRVYSGHSNAELYGAKYEPRRGIAGGFYASEDPAIASHYAMGKIGDNRRLQDGSQYRFRLKNGSWGKKLWQMELTPDQQQKTREFFADEANGTAWDIERYWRENAPYDAASRRALARGGLKDLASIYKFLEYMGETIAYQKDDPSGKLSPVERQQTNTFEDLLDHLDIEWQSEDWLSPGVMPVYLSIKNPLDAEQPFPADLLAALKQAAKYKRMGNPGNTRWTKDYPLKQWVADIEGGDEYWTTHIPSDAMPILRRFGYDGIKERGMKGVTARSQRQINWIAFDSTQIKSATGNIGTFDPNNPDIRYRGEGASATDRATAAQRAALVKLNQKIFGDRKVDFDRVFNELGKEQAGQFENDLITINEGVADPTETFWHEAVHKAERLFLTDAERQSLEAMQPDAEKRAEDILRFAKWRDWAKTQATWTTKARTIVIRLLDTIKRLVGPDQGFRRIADFYAELTAGDYRGQATATEREAQPAFRGDDAEADNLTASERFARAYIAELNMTPEEAKQFLATHPIAWWDEFVDRIRKNGRTLRGQQRLFRAIKDSGKADAGKLTEAEQLARDYIAKLDMTPEEASAFMKKYMANTAKELTKQGKTQERESARKVYTQEYAKPAPKTPRGMLHGAERVGVKSGKVEMSEKFAEAFKAVTDETEAPKTIYGTLRKTEAIGALKERKKGFVRAAEDAIDITFRQMAEEHRSNPTKWRGLLDTVNTDLETLDLNLANAKDDQHREWIAKTALRVMFGDRRYLAIRRASRGDVFKTVDYLKRTIGEQMTKVYSALAANEIARVNPDKLYNDPATDLNLADQWRELMSQYGVAQKKSKAIRDAKGYLAKLKKMSASPADIKNRTAGVEKMIADLTSEMAQVPWKSSRELYEKLAEIRAADKSVKQQVHDDRVASLERRIDEVVKTIAEGNDDILSAITESGVAPRRRGLFKSTFVDSRGDMESWANTLAGGREESAVHDVLVKRLRSGHEESMRPVMEGNKEFWRVAKQLGFSEKDIELMDAQRKPHEIDGFTHRLTDFQIMNLYLHTLNDGARMKVMLNGPKSDAKRGLITLGRDVIGATGGEDGIPNAVEKLIGTLSDKQKNLALAMMAIKNAYTQQGNATALRVKGMELFLEPNHWGLKVDVGDTEKLSATDLSDPKKARATLMQHLFGMTKARVPHSHTVLMPSAYGEFVRQLEDIGRFIHMTEPALDALAVLNSPRVRQAMIERYGTGFGQRIRDVISEAAGMTAQQSGWGWIRATAGYAQRRISGAKLGYRFTSIANNAVGGSILLTNELSKVSNKLAADFAVERGKGVFFTAGSENARLRDVLLDNPFFYDRFNMHLLRTMANLPTDLNDRQTLRAVRKRKRMEIALRGMAHEELCNAVAAVKAYKKNGYSESDAVRAVNLATRRTQNPSTPFEATGWYSGIQRSGLGVVIPFFGQVSVAANILLRDAQVFARAMATGKAKTQAANRLVKTMGALTANAAFTSGLRYAVARISAGALYGLIPDDQKKRLDEYAAMGLMGELMDVIVPGSGRLATVSVQAVKNVIKSKNPAQAVNALGSALAQSERELTETLPGSTLRSGGLAVKDIATGISDDEWWKIERGLLRAVEFLGEVAGEPVGGPVQAAKIVAGLAGRPIGKESQQKATPMSLDW